MSVDFRFQKCGYTHFLTYLNARPLKSLYLCTVQKNRIR
jgi:hypothetical protein